MQQRNHNFEKKWTPCHPWESHPTLPSPRTSVGPGGRLGGVLQTLGDVLQLLQLFPPLRQQVVEPRPKTLRPSEAHVAVGQK